MNGALLNLFIRPGDQTLDVRLPRRRMAVGTASTLKDGTRVVLLQDITEKHDLESRREALISTMAHDMRNPISAIGGFAELVGKFGDLNTEQQHFINRIRQTTTKLYDIAGSLVDLAWIEAGMPLTHVPTQLASQVKNVVDELATTARRNQVIIVTSLQDPMPLVVGDPARIRMVIFHLIQNAILYSHTEGTVAIHIWGDEHEAYFSVADRGIGISDEELDMIFDRLYRSRDERVRDIPGGGLGLTLARTIIKRHGGDIWATSNLGEGSTFTFVLPVIPG